MFKKKIKKEKLSYTDRKHVSAEHYNDMIAFYTRECEEKDKRLLQLKKDNERLIKSLIRNSERLVDLENTD